MIAKRAFTNFLKSLNIQEINPLSINLPLLDAFVIFNGKRIGVEIEAGIESEREIFQIAQDISASSQALDMMIIVSKSENKFIRETIRSVFQSLNIQCELRVMNLFEIQEFFGVVSTIDLSDFHIQNLLRTCAISKQLSVHIRAERNSAQIQYADRNEISEFNLKRTHDEAVDFIQSIPQQVISLRRNISFKKMAEITLSDQLNFDETFHVGGADEDLFVVLTDIKNSSVLANAARPSYLNFLMLEYYRKSREIAFLHGGYVDKFIGDGVSVLFNFPEKQVGDPISAFRFAADVIRLGQLLFQGLLNEMNAKVDLGTRVGIANGPLRVLDIGVTEPELSFIGDTYNLAARLEKNSPVNGVLADNKTSNRLRTLHPGFYNSMSPKEKILEGDKAKGQMFPIRTFEYDIDAIDPTPNSLVVDVAQADVRGDPGVTTTPSLAVP